MGLARRIIPCLDIDNGRVVKGVNFVDIVDAGDPVDAARSYDAAGADEITFLDITASSDNRGIILEIVEQVAAQVFIPLTVGGGVREFADILEAKGQFPAFDPFLIDGSSAWSQELQQQLILLKVWM